MINLLNNIVNPAFYNILYMSIIGTFVGIFILIIRKIFDKKISPKWKCIIWLLLLFSLIIPVKITIEPKQKNIQVLSISSLVEPIQDIYKVTEEIEVGDLSSSNVESQTDKNGETINGEIINQEVTSKKIASEEYTSEKTISKNDSAEIIQETSTQNINLKKIILNDIIPAIWILGILFNIILLTLGNINIKNNIRGKTYTDKILDNLLNECRKNVGIK